MSILLAHGSLALALVWLLVGSIGLPLPEDIALLAIGALVFNGLAIPELAIPLAFLCVVGGDTLLFSFAKRWGPRAYDRKLVARVITPARRERFERLYAHHGGKIVFVARHVAGFRAATFALAGIHGMPTARFLLWDGLGAAISVPLMLALGYFGASHLDLVRSGIAHVEHYVALVAIIVVAIVLVVVRLRRR